MRAEQLRVHSCSDSRNSVVPVLPDHLRAVVRATAFDDVEEAQRSAR